MLSSHVPSCDSGLRSQWRTSKSVNRCLKPKRGNAASTSAICFSSRSPGSGQSTSALAPRKINMASGPCRKGSAHSPVCSSTAYQARSACALDPPCLRSHCSTALAPSNSKTFLWCLKAREQANVMKGGSDKRVLREVCPLLLLLQYQGPKDKCARGMVEEKVRAIATCISGRTQCQWGLRNSHAGDLFG